MAAAAATAALDPARAFAGAAARTDPRPDEGSSRRVAVAGAGLAGLTAAVDLVDAGWDVVVFESRDRVGGRVHTLRDPFSGALHAESGGESIDDSHHAIRALIRRFGLHTEHRALLKPYDAMVYYQGFREPLGVFLTRRDGGVLRDVLRFYNAMAALAGGVDPEYPERAPNAADLDARSLEGFLVEQHLVPEAEFLMRLQNRAEYNAELRDISLLFVAQQEAVAPDGTLSLLSSETRRIKGGNSRLPEAMAEALGDRVRVGAAVTRVQHHRDGVSVDAGARRTHAGWLVVAAPMPPIRRVRFDPPLPPSVRTMIDGLDLGHAVKIIREYLAPFWTAEGFSGFTLTDLPFAVGWSPTDSYPAVQGLLTEFITGDAANTAARMPPGRREEVFLAQLDRVYPEGAPLATNLVATKAWANDPNTGGGYAVYKPGQMVPFFPVLRDGTGRILFAGEHTCPLAGYMESAVRSGHTVAAKIGRPPG